MTFSMSFEVTGSQQMVDAIRNAFSELAPQMEGVLVEEAEEIMGASKEIVPVDQGILRASGGIYGTEVSADSVAVQFGYGGAAANYAVIQHETPPDVFSHTEGRSWKYLEIPVLEAVKDMGPRIASRLSGRIAERFRGA